MIISMETIYCNACHTENDSNSAKCEQCKSILLDENNFSNHGECENDFLFIENAEIKGNIFKLENLDESDKAELGIRSDNGQIIQAIKEEPEFQIEPEILVENEKRQDSTETRPYKCDECNKCFKRKASLLCHKNVKHCKSDFYAVYTDSSSKKSMPKSKNSPQSYKKQLESRKTDENRMSTPEMATLKCDLCNEFFSNNDSLKSHRIVCEKKEKFHCDVCEIFVNCKGALRKHEKSRYHTYNLGKGPSKEPSKYMCLFCGEKFAFQIHLTKHKKLHTEETEVLNTTSRIEVVNGRTIYFCRVCGKSSTNKSHHTQHILVHTKEVMNGRTVYFCRICGKSFTNRAHHTEHTRVHTKEKGDVCELCGTAFTKRSSLVQHMTLHSDDRPYKCNICEVTYRHKKNLKKHLFMHTGERPFKCKYCDKTFALRYTFNDHVRLLHTGETPFQCDECSETFKTSYLFNIHRREKHNIDTNSKRRVTIFPKKVVSGLISKSE